MVILQFRMPNAAIESLTGSAIQDVHWPDSEWKQLIWHCRRKMRLPLHLSKYKEATLVGTITTKPSEVYHNLSSWEDITYIHVMKVHDDSQECLAV